MKSSRSLCMLFVFGFIVPLAADDNLKPAKTPTGTWRLDYDFQGRAIHDEIRLRLDDKGKVSGQLYRNQRKPIDVTEGTFVDGIVTFTISGNANGTEWKTVYKGEGEWR